MTETLIQILLVEDSATDALLLEHELAESSFGPFSARRATSLDQALTELGGRHFDVVLLDLGLPDSQGLETLERLLQQHPVKLPIVVLTGLNDQLLGIRALQEGAEDYLVKSGTRDSMRAIRYAIERKRAGEAILASQQQLAMAVHAAELGLFEWNLTSGKITWSFHYSRLLGFEGGEFGGTFDAFKRCIHPEDRAGITEAINRSIAAREEYRQEYRVIWPDNSEHWIEGRGKVFKDDRGEPSRMLGTVMDISQRKANEVAVKAREVEATRLGRANLTPRELTLFKMIVGGLSNKQIAFELNISARTVAKHRSHLMAKTQALNAADLARMGTLAGIPAH
jgi:two-component system sensor histidine kinase UhpB